MRSVDTQVIVEVIGWTGSICLLICGLPQLILTLRSRDVTSLSLSMLLFWYVGLILSGAYVLLTTQQLPLLLNYGFNTGVVTVLLIAYCKFKK
jgi:uncharacterized protein with PQ loop repeat